MQYILPDQGRYHRIIKDYKRHETLFRIGFQLSSQRGVVGFDNLSVVIENDKWLKNEWPEICFFVK